MRAQRIAAPWPARRACGHNRRRPWRRCRAWPPVPSARAPCVRPGSAAKTASGASPGRDRETGRRQHVLAPGNRRSAPAAPDAAAPSRRRADPARWRRSAAPMMRRSAAARARPSARAGRAPRRSPPSRGPCGSSILITAVPVLGQDAGEEPGLGGEIGLEIRVIIEVVLGEVGEARRRQPHPVEPALVEPVATRPPSPHG